MRTQLDRLNSICNDSCATVETVYNFSIGKGLIEIYSDSSNRKPDYIVSSDNLNTAAEIILKAMVNDNYIKDEDVTRLYNPKEMAEYLREKLNVDHPNLASLLGVSSDSLSSWCSLEREGLEGRSLRLKRLFEVTYYLSLSLKDYQCDECRSLLYNARFIFDPTDEEEGSVSLIDHILAHPESLNWKTTVDDVVLSYRKLQEEELSALALKCKKPMTEQEKDVVDRYYNLSIVILLDEEVISASLLQRKLKIGYNTACHLIDKLESDKIVGPIFDKFYHKILIKNNKKSVEA